MDSGANNVFSDRSRRIVIGCLIEVDVFCVFQWPIGALFFQPVLIDCVVGAEQLDLYEHYQTHLSTKCFSVAHLVDTLMPSGKRLDRYIRIAWTGDFFV